MKIHPNKPIRVIPLTFHLSPFTSHLSPPSSVSTPSQLRVKSEKLTFIRKKTTFQFINLDGLRQRLRRHRQHRLTRVRRRPACKKINEQFTAIRVKRKICVSIKQPSRAASDTLERSTRFSQPRTRTIKSTRFMDFAQREKKKDQRQLGSTAMARELDERRSPTTVRVIRKIRR